MLQVVQIELGEHIEMLLSDDTATEDHYGVMEVSELFEDDKVTVYTLCSLSINTAATMYSILVLAIHAPELPS